MQGKSCYQYLQGHTAENQPPTATPMPPQASKAAHTLVPDHYP